MLVAGDSYYVANSNGRGTRASPDGLGPTASAQAQRQGPGATRARPSPDTTYTWGQFTGKLMAVALKDIDDTALAPLSARVAHASGWDAPTGTRQSATRVEYPLIQHVVYIIKENRTFDQIFSDFPSADAVSTLLFFGRNVSPNHHALAEPANGYLWNFVQAKGLSIRNYGAFVIPPDARGRLPAGYRGNKPFLEAHTNPDFPSYDLDILDQRRADVHIAELQECVRHGALPALSIVRPPNDHSAGARLGAPTPRAYFADNDLALDRITEALSRIQFLRNTAVFVREDDAQNGPDHVDSHRSPLLVISPWSRGSVHHRFANTTDVLATIEEILGLGAL